MPSSNIFAVGNEGRVFSLQTDNTIWKELTYLGVDFKRVSAHDNVVWALGGDHQIYVYVYGTSVPIRVCEEAYENQRWNPLEGFTDNLLPTDRPVFSSSDGLQDRHLTDIRLPTLAWNWEGPWHLQDIFEGKALDKESWTYAVDFPRCYTSYKQWTSCVRRRKWIRYRRYIALDTWSAVPALHKDYTDEPFIDICVGGGDVLGEDPDKLMVWGVSTLGKVMVRKGTCAICPEGSSWDHIATPEDVTSLSIGRSGRVWAVAWDGCVLIRTGISRDNPTGIGWISANPPDNLGIHQIAVGVSSVWALCRDGSVWFRRGLKSRGFEEANRSSMHDNSSCGYSWLQMVGFMVMISVGPNDQVWGISKDDHSIMLRSGVLKTDLTGKTWKPIHLPLLRYDPDNEDNIFDSEETSSEISEIEESKDLPLDNEESIPVMQNLSEDFEDKRDMESYTSAESSDVLNNSSNISEDHLTTSESAQLPHLGDEDKGSIEADLKDLDLNVKDLDLEETSNSLDTIVSDTIADFVGTLSLEEDISTLLNNKNAIDPVVEDGPLSEPPLPLPAIRSRLSSNASSIGSETFFPREGIESIRQEEDDLGLQVSEGSLWSWMTGGGCWIMPHYLPKWFIPETAAEKESAPWQRAIMDDLLTRRQREICDFSGYEEAVENSSWSVVGQCRFLASGQWVPANLELNMVASSKGLLIQEASLKVSYSLRKKSSTVIPCRSIVLSTLCVDLPAKSLVSLYTPLQPLKALSFLFSAEKDAEDWIHHIFKACHQFRGSKKSVSHSTLWGVSALGDVYLHDFCSSEDEIKAETKAAHTEIDIGNGDTPFMHRLERGFKPGCFITVSASVPEDATSFRLDLCSSESPTADVVLHIGVRFNEKVIVFNTFEDGKWLKEERSGLSSIARGSDYELTLHCTDKDFKISINGDLHQSFCHRLPPNSVTDFRIDGNLKIRNIVYNYGAGDRALSEYFWQNVGGHLNKVETGAGGITWGISHDSHVYVHTGTFNKELLRGNASNESGIYLMTDVRHFYVWENQRWNPLTGFTCRGLPTDRHSWSDQTGKHHRTKDGVKLPSRHWQWTGDWVVDHHTPNGVDKDGWQYATDFPMSFHSHCYATDLVRRRRWLRKCCISTYGPWKQMEKVALFSLSISPEYTSFSTIPVWGVSVSNEVVMREGVTKTNPNGTRWTLIPSESPMADICAGIDSGVWAVSAGGQAHVRIGVTRKNPKGTEWINVDAPGVPLKQVGVGNGSVWALDRDGGIYIRANVQPLFPEGTDWTKLCDGVKCISVSIGGSLWAVLQYSPGKSDHQLHGILARRIGTTPQCPIGTDWSYCAGTCWNYVSCRLPSEHGAEV